MDEYLECFIADAGHPTPYTPADEAALAQLAPKVPAKLIEYWRELGFSSFKNGLLSVVNPLEWQDTLDEWLEASGLDEIDHFIPLFRGAFGDFKFYGLNTGISLSLSTSIGRFHGNREGTAFLHLRGPDFRIQSTFSGISPARFDTGDEQDKKLFERALAKLGPLAANEIYGFVPMLPMGGRWRLEDLQRVDAQVHLSILLQMTELSVVWVDDYPLPGR